LERESKPALTLAVITFIVEMNHVTMGVERFFQGGPLVDFSKRFSGVGQKW